jgi:hypothetical protein
MSCQSEQSFEIHKGQGLAEQSFFAVCYSFVLAPSPIQVKYNFTPSMFIHPFPHSYSSLALSRIALNSSRPSTPIVIDASPSGCPSTPRINPIRALVNAKRSRLRGIPNMSSHSLDTASRSTSLVLVDIQRHEGGDAIVAS